MSTLLLKIKSQSSGAASLKDRLPQKKSYKQEKSSVHEEILLTLYLLQGSVYDSLGMHSFTLVPCLNTLKY